MYSFDELKKLSKKEAGAFKKIKIAILADSSTQFLALAIKGYGVANSIQYDVWEADINQIDRQVFDPTSELYQFAPDYVLILISTEHLLGSFYKKTIEHKEHFAKEHISYLESLIQQISEKLSSKIITNSYGEINDRVFGNYSAKVRSSFIYQIRKLNAGMLDWLQTHNNLFLLDVSSLVTQIGYDAAFNPILYVNADVVYSFDLLPYIASNLHSIIQSLNGYLKKCLILDLDNTMWGGVIGDDGMEGIKIGNLGIGKAFSEFQLWIKQLKNRGIILAVCSKNTEAIAKEPFEKHPDMELRLDDIALFVANWENKVDNIRYIQNILQIGFDSMVFLDDNPFEREIVKNGIPELCVPDLPEDPALYLTYLKELNLFETVSFTEEDTIRTKQYQEEANRAVIKRSFANENEFLNSLSMQSEVLHFNAFSIPRVVQLIQRSNQFNLRTQRYAEADVVKMTESSDYITLSFTLEDKFGNHGLIGAVILKRIDKQTLFIDTWIMSCRVLKRGMEQFTLYCLVKEAAKRGYSKLVGEYIPTAKNGIVKEHYSSLGFEPMDGKWVLNIDKEKQKNNSHIKIK